MSEQPRVPAGSPRGGEWTKAGSSTIRGAVSSRGDYAATKRDWKPSEEGKSAISDWEDSIADCQEFQQMAMGELEPSKAFKAFEEAIQSSPRFKGSTYRGLSNIDPSTFTVGSEVDLKSYASSSANHKAALHFARHRIDIEALAQVPTDPKRGVVLVFGRGSRHKADISSQTGNDYEEVVMQPSKWKVVRVNKPLFYEGVTEVVVHAIED